MKNIISKIILAIIMIIIVVLIIKTVIFINNKPIYKENDMFRGFIHEEHGFIIYANGTIEEFDKYGNEINLNKSKISKEELKELKKLIRDLEEDYKENINENVSNSIIENVFNSNMKSEIKVYKTFSNNGIKLYYSDGKKVGKNEHQNADKIIEMVNQLEKKYLNK